MNSRRGVLGWMGAAALLPAACASPNPNLYTLAPVPGPSLPGGPRTVTLRAIGLARYLERSQIVLSSEDYRLTVSAHDWWGEPLGAMLSRILVAELSQRLPGTTVYSDAGAITVPPEATVEVNVQRLDADSAGAIILDAQLGVAFDNPRRGPATRSLHLSVPQPGPGAAGHVAACSMAVGQLADQLAAMLRGAGRS